MSVAQVRNSTNTAWVDSTMVGAARVGGLWVPFGPSGATPQSLFTSQTPVADGSDGSPGITTGTSVVFGVAGSITHVRFYAGASPSGTYTGAVWRTVTSDLGSGGTGTLLQSKAFSGTPVPGWNLIALDTPIVVTPNTVLYRLGCHNPTRYVATNGAFASSSIVNGDITAPFNGADPVGLGTFYQGTFSINASPTYPQQLGASANYFVDCVFVPA